VHFNQLAAKGVYGGNIRRGVQGRLQLFGYFILHAGGGGLREGDNAQPVQTDPFIYIARNPRGQHGRFARAGGGGNQNKRRIAINGRLLVGGKLN
jgi:hypothetical protein